MKYIYLALSLLIPQSLVHANTYSLSPESQKFVMLSAAAGALAAGTVGLLVGLDENSKHPEKHTSKKTTWEKIKEFPWSYVAIPAAIGAVVGGGISYFFTAEKYLESAENDLYALENDTVLKMALGSDDPVKIKKWYFSERFPTIRVYEKLESLYSSITSIKNYFIKVIQSGIRPLVRLAECGLERVERIEQKLVDWMIKLKEDPKYLKELNARSTIAHQQHMENLQHQLVHAQQKAADAAWHAAHHPSAHHFVIQGPKPDIIIIKK